MEKIQNHTDAINIMTMITLFANKCVIFYTSPEGGKRSDKLSERDSNNWIRLNFEGIGVERL